MDYNKDEEDYRHCFNGCGFDITIIGMTILFKAQSSVPSNAAIIGGADGPTLIFMAGRIGYPVYGSIIGGVITLVAGLLLVLMKKD